MITLNKGHMVRKRSLWHIRVLNLSATNGKVSMVPGVMPSMRPSRFMKCPGKEILLFLTHQNLSSQALLSWVIITHETNADIIVHLLYIYSHATTF